MKSKLLQTLAILLILEIGLVHYLNAQHEFEEAALLGYLFLANFLISLVAAYGVFRQRGWGWALGFCLAAGSIGGYLWSRTSGLPGLETEPWTDPWGMVSLAVEGLYLLLLLFRPWHTAPTGVRQISSPAWLRYTLPIAGVTLLILANGLANAWETAAGGHEHEFSLSEVRRTPLTSAAVLEEEYGMRIEQVAISALDSIVDVRLKVLDPEKAYLLLEDHAALLVDGQALILAPHMHDHGRVKPGGIYFMFFPTQNHTAHSGSEVSLVFEGLRVEPVIAQ